MRRNYTPIIAMMLVAWLPTLVLAQSAEVTRGDIDRAAVALAAAEAAGAPLYARAVYSEALNRLNMAREEVRSEKRSLRDDAQQHALEAYHAARAAEAIARAVGVALEAESVRVSIRELGGNARSDAQPLQPEATLERGDTSRDRVAFARSILDRAKTAAAQNVAPEEMESAERNLRSAERIVKADKNNRTADHLAYVAEMLARRAEAMARRREVDREMPGLRIERTRLAEAASAAQAARDRQAREEAERRAAELRAQLEREGGSRRAQEAELARLRQQLAENELMLRRQLDDDRRARLEAERSLDQLRVQYQAALSTSVDPVEVERLRRQVEDQSIALRAMQERERLSEASMGEEIARLEEELRRSRSQGNANAEMLAAREAEVQRMQQELQRMQSERQSAEAQRAETERAQLRAIEAAEVARRAAEEESAKLRQEVAEERARAEEARAELARARDEMEQRDRARTEDMRRALAAIADTRTESRGFIVTLPGIFFDTGRSTLKPGARNVLSRIADQLLTNPKLRVTIEGHTDSVGSDDANMKLSRKRAEAVRDFLVQRGVAPSVFAIDAKGESSPVATNDTPAGRQQNRRVELVIAE